MIEKISKAGAQENCYGALGAACFQKLAPQADCFLGTQLGMWKLLSNQNKVLVALFDNLGVSSRINRITSNILIYNQRTHNKRTAEKIAKRTKVEPLYDFAIFARHFHRETRHRDRRVKSKRMCVATT